jgi:hypothetical protein
LSSSGHHYVKTQTYSPTSQAEQVGKQANEEPGLVILPFKRHVKTNGYFYPGALVEPESYSVWAKELADAGYPVYIMKMPLDLAVLAPDRSEKVLKEQPKRPFIMGGHSLGGVMASRFAKDHSDNLKGVFFLASYPDEKGRLADSGIPVLSLTGENDHVLDKEAYQEAKKNLPEANRVSRNRRRKPCWIWCLWASKRRWKVYDQRSKSASSTAADPMVRYDKIKKIPYSILEIKNRF